MSRSYNISFWAEKRTPLIELIISEIKKEREVMDFGDGVKCYGNQLWIHENGSAPDYFGAEELLKNHPTLKAYVHLSSHNSIFYEDGKRYMYQTPYFKHLMGKIKASKLKNNIYLLCNNDIGDINKTKPAIWKLWTGKHI